MDLKENKEAYIGGFGERKWKGKIMSLYFKSKKIIFKKITLQNILSKMKRYIMG